MSTGIYKRLLLIFSVYIIYPEVETNMMYELVSYKIVYPSFSIEQIATPQQSQLNSSSPLYNSTSLQSIPLVVLPSGGKYTVQFETETFLELSLDTFIIQQTTVYPSELSQDSFYQQSYDTSQPLSSTSGQTGYNVTRQSTETLYLKGDSFTVDTTNLSESQIVTISLPTYIPLQVGLSTYSSAYDTTVSLIYPTTAFYTNTNIINPQNWNIISPFGIQYSVAVSPLSGVLYTVGFDIPDLYGNIPKFTINQETLGNTVFDSTPTINQNFVPELPYNSFENINPMQMIINGKYNYGSFSSLGISDGLITDYPVFFKEYIRYTGGYNSNNQPVFALLLALSLAGTDNGIKPYGLMLGSIFLGGYTEPLMQSPFIIPSQTNNLSVTLQSNARILPTLLSSSSSVQTMTSYSSSSSAVSSSSSVSSSSTSTTTTTTTTTNVSKTNINLVNLLTSPLAVLIILLALIGIILFITV